MNTPTLAGLAASANSCKLVSPKRLSAWLHCGEELSLLDVREVGQFGEGHLFHAIPLPFSRLELEVGRLVPRVSTPIVVSDESGGDLAQRAVKALTLLGYDLVSVLEGGVRGWSDAGLHLFKGVNLPSKTFGELVESRLHTPRISAHELAKRQARGDNLLVLDGRPLNEFRKMSIPGAVCCPNGELALRIGALAPDPETTIVINCAGRTRSIIGAQTLINLGIPNPVFALENGTQGWYLEDLGLEHGQTRRFPDSVSAGNLSSSRHRALAIARRYAVPVLDAASAQAIIDDTSSNCFVLDVRTAEEFAARTLPGAQHAPGGQLLQATDQFVGVRNARLLLVDSEGVRALVVASWLRQMGHDASVIEQGIFAPLRLPARPTLADPGLREVSAAGLAALIATNAVHVIDTRASMTFRQAHIPGAHWTIRPVAMEALTALAAREQREVVLVSDDASSASLYARDMLAEGLAAPLLLSGGFAAWRQGGHPVESSPDSPPDGQCIDYLFFVHDRHDGNKAAARQYLAWETGLLGMLEPQEISSFAPR